MNCSLSSNCFKHRTHYYDTSYSSQPINVGSSRKIKTAMTRNKHFTTTNKSSSEDEIPERDVAYHLI